MCDVLRRRTFRYPFGDISHGRRVQCPSDAFAGARQTIIILILGRRRPGLSRPGRVGASPPGYTVGRPIVRQSDARRARQSPRRVEGARAKNRSGVGESLPSALAPPPSVSSHCRRFPAVEHCTPAERHVGAVTDCFHKTFEDPYLQSFFPLKSTRVPAQ